MKEALLAAVIAEAGGVDGRVKLQKLVYLLQRMGYALGYEDYRLRDYGPYSEDLAGALDLACVGLLSEREELLGSDDLGRPVSQFCYEACPELRPLLEKVLSRAFGDRVHQLQCLSKDLSSRPRGVLEVAATAVYARDEMGIRDESELWREVERRKGHLGSHFPAARKLLADWDSLGVLGTAAAIRA